MIRVVPSNAEDEISLNSSKGDLYSACDDLQNQEGEETDQDFDAQRRQSYVKALHHPVDAVVTAEQQNILKPHEIELGVTLVAISLVFVVCQSIKLIPDIYEIIVCDHFSHSSQELSCHAPVFIDALMSLANLFCCINSAANFLFYMLRGKKFRDAFKQTYFSTCRLDSRGQCCGEGKNNGRNNGSPLGISLQTLDHNTRTTLTTPNRLLINNGRSTTSSRLSPISVAAV